MTDEPPVVLLAFANDYEASRHLRQLAKEKRAIEDALELSVKQKRIALRVITNATVPDIIKAFTSEAGRVVAFHYGGHASETGIQLEGDDGERAVVSVDALAEYLALQQRLELVFLNGCATKEQAQSIRTRGVKAVVATSRAIQDDAAARFAALFYQHLLEHPLGEAFDKAAAATRLDGKLGLARPRDAYVAGRREIAVDLHEDAGEELGWPWELYCEPEGRGWRLVSAEPPAPPPLPPPPPDPGPGTKPWPLWSKLVAALLGVAVLAGMAVVVTKYLTIDPDPDPDPIIEPKPTPPPGPNPDPPRPPDDEPTTTGPTTTGPTTTGPTTTGPTTTGPTTGATTITDPPPRVHCRIDRDYQDTWRQRCTPGQSTKTSRLQGNALRRYKDGRSSVSRCDTITLYWCE